MKTDHVLDNTRHTEWFCTHLAESVGIACPHPAVLVDDRSGSYIFGSRWEGGVANGNWWEMVERGDIDISIIGPILSRIFAFDCFVYNEDRHLNNYLARDTRNGWALFAMDFSRAWMTNSFPPSPLPFSDTDNTLLGIRDLMSMFGNFIDISATTTVLNTLKDIKVSDIRGIIERHPDEWLSDANKNAILDWWQSQGRLDRIEGIKKGIGLLPVWWTLR